VTIFNELFDICNVYGVNYRNIRNMMLQDERIGRSHTAVTKQRGFGGSCFPKDLNALIKDLEKKGYNAYLLKTVWNKNCEVRKVFSTCVYEG
jgi:UDP-glucose 6-dehydrogenase